LCVSGDKQSGGHHRTPSSADTSDNLAEACKGEKQSALAQESKLREIKSDFVGSFTLKSLVRG
jgi:hypothetical protein